MGEAGEAGAGVDLARPADDDRAGWRAYWAERGMPWRSEPEIGAERRAYLGKRRAVTPDIARGIYPFRDENGSIKLDRVDVEWLLATHESGGMRGPVGWSDVKQRGREGLDLRGADLLGADLRGLPLACLQGGLSGAEWLGASPDRRDLAGIVLQGANLRAARLQGAILRRANLEGATFYQADLEWADLRRARMEGTDLGEARLGGTSLRGVYLNNLSRVDRARLAARDRVGPSVADVQWDGVNLAVVDWRAPRMLGDEREARRRADDEGKAKPADVRLDDWEAAVRSNRQLSTVLRDQGLNEYGDRFAYRAQVLQRQVLARQGRWGPWLVSWALAVLAGYGYRLWRIFAAYGLVVTLFAAGYFFSGHALTGPHVSTQIILQGVADAYQVSLNAIHGRVFFVQFGLDTLQSWLATAESIIGIVIEGVFVAMIIQRFFAR